MDPHRRRAGIGGLVPRLVSVRRSLLLVTGAYMAYLGWARATGRAGDGTWRTHPGGHLPVLGRVRDPRAVGRRARSRHDAEDLIVETRRRVRPRRSLPLLGGRRSVQRDDAVSLPYRFLPPLPYQEMIELYATSPASRDDSAPTSRWNGRAAS